MQRAKSDERFALCSSPFARCALLFGFLLLLSPSTRASEIGEFLGRRVTSVEVVIEGAPGGGIVEMRSLLDVAAGQDYSPVRIHDSLLRLYHSGLISGARVEGVPDDKNGVALRFVIKPQVRIDSVIFEGTPTFPVAELRARLNQLDAGSRLSAGAIARGLGDLSAYYAARGYYQARVVPDVRLDASNTRAVVVYTITPGEQARVSSYKLEVKGTQVDLSKVPKTIVEGQPFAQAAVGETIDRIRDAYLKQNYLAVRITSNVEPDLDNNKVAASITVESGPKVEVEVQGLTISDKDRTKTLPFYQQGGIDEFSLEEARRRLQDYAQKRGYFFAQVTRPDAPDLSQQSVKLVFKVDPGARYKLSNIDIHGVDALPHRDLETQMKSKTASPIPLFGLGRGITSDDMLRQDSNLIAKRLREVGYRRARVDTRRGVSVKGEKLIITFDVQQGPRTFIDEVALRGNNVLSRSELAEDLSVKARDPLTAAAVNKTNDQILAAYTTRGYATAEVAPEVVDLGNADGEERARLIFNVTEGNRARIRVINTRGTAKTDVGRLERDFYDFKKGAQLRPDKLQETERQLYDTAAFNSVAITSEPVGETPDGVEQRDVTVNLLEAKRYDLITGIGYQTNKGNLAVPGLAALNGVRGLVQLTQTNMFGKLYTGSAQLRVSQNELFGSLSFQNPRMFGTRYPVLFSVFARRLAQTTFRSDRYTAQVQAERRLSPDFIVYLAYNFERVSVFDLPCPKPSPDCLGLTLEEIERNSRPIRLGRIGPRFALDRTNNRFDPSSGSRTLGSFDFASPFLGGNEEFVKFLIEHNRFYPISRFRDTVYSISGRLGLAVPFGGRLSLPISERFFAGGALDLRGFGFEEAGPHIFVPKRDSNGDIILNSNGEPTLVVSPLGGNAVLVLNNTLRFPLFGPLLGTVFSDTGNVFARVRDMKFSNLTESVGVGIRIKTPIGPVRLEYGVLVWNKPPGVKGSHLHFTIGPTF
ncbi:MAG TPA: POTRA domain-containing protein [Blastocatellia bacterium]|nr:POTRA domain-containing protein [Blastocatellia bacterium]